MTRLNTNTILWLVYLSLLAVLLPHTAWAFGGFEQNNRLGQVVAWAAAFTFEAGIAAFTYKLAQHIERVPNHKSAWLRWRKRYLNAYLGSLLFLVGVSTLANLAHAIEFGRPLAIFDRWGVPFGVYAVAFGGILPFVSLSFARVLSNVQETEQQDSDELIAAKQTIKELRAILRQTEQRAQQAEQRFGAIGDLIARLFADEKRQRILAVAERWPQLPPASIAIVSESSPSYVSEVLSQTNGREHDE